MVESPSRHGHNRSLTFHSYRVCKVLVAHSITGRVRQIPREVDLEICRGQLYLVNREKGHKFAVFEAHDATRYVDLYYNEARLDIVWVVDRGHPEPHIVGAGQRDVVVFKDT